MAGGLQRAVAVEQPRPDRARGRMGLQEGDQRRQRAGMDHRIAVEQQEVRAAGLREGLVVGARKAHVGLVFNQRDPGKAFPHHLRAAVGGGVVDDEGFYAAGRGACAGLASGRLCGGSG